MTRTEGDF